MSQPQEHPSPNETDENAVGVAGEVDLRVPADSAYVAVLRSVTAGLAARCDLTLDEIEDLRIAVDEACALLLPLSGPSSFLLTKFALEPGCLIATVSMQTRIDVRLDREGFAWTVLDALSSTVTVHEQDESISISLTKRRDDPSR